MTRLQAGSGGGGALLLALALASFRPGTAQAEAEGGYTLLPDPGTGAITPSPLQRRVIPISYNDTNCRTCLEFVDDSLHELNNITKGNNVPKTCSALCDELANATSPTHANFTRSTCGTLCTGFTYPAFVKWAQQGVFNGIRSCELLQVCKTNPDGDAAITEFSITPLYAWGRTPRTINFSYHTTNGTGTGQIAFNITTPFNGSIVALPQVYVPYSDATNTSGGQVDFIPWLAKGRRVGATASQSVRLDDMLGYGRNRANNETLPTGHYTMEMFMCSGDCFDTCGPNSNQTCPHSKVYSTQKANFTVIGTSHHYEDPTHMRCGDDEVPIKLPPILGSWCAPSCDASKPCPMDVPDAARAQPKCLISKAGSQTPSSCVLICDPAGWDQCPLHASCKKVLKTGICTYDT